MAGAEFSSKVGCAGTVKPGRCFKFLCCMAARQIALSWAQSWPGWAFYFGDVVSARKTCDPALWLSLRGLRDDAAPQRKGDL